MANAPSTASAPERIRNSVTNVLTGIVGRAVLFVVALVVAGYVIDTLTTNTAMTGVLVGILYSLAGVTALVGVVAIASSLIRRAE